jgi:hypothetical protein
MSPVDCPGKESARLSQGFRRCFKNLCSDCVRIVLAMDKFDANQTIFYRLAILAICFI